MATPKTIDIMYLPGQTIFSKRPGQLEITDTNIRATLSEDKDKPSEILFDIPSSQVARANTSTKVANVFALKADGKKYTFTIEHNISGSLAQINEALSEAGVAGPKNASGSQLLVVFGVVVIIVVIVFVSIKARH